MACFALSFAFLPWRCQLQRSFTGPRPAHSSGAISSRHHTQPVHRGPRAHASIIGGTIAENGTFPWLAYIADFKNEEEIGLCTGTVVALNVILTAAHCAEDVETGVLNEPANYRIVTGNVDWHLLPEQVRPVEDHRISRLCSRVLDRDAALLVLAASTTAPAISLWASGTVNAGTAALIAGWGQTYFERETLTERLRWANTVVQGPEWCALHAPPFYEHDELCAINPPSYSTGVCHGDSGGPLLASSPSGLIEIGITSHGYAECSTAEPSVFTRTDLIHTWVHEWSEAVKPPPPTPPTPTPTPKAPAPSPPPVVTKPPPAPVAPWVPPNTPGLYVTPHSKVGRRITARVSGDGAHLVGIAIKTTIQCQHGYTYEVASPWLSYSDNVPISNHVAATTLETEADQYMRSGHIGLYLFFNSAGSLEGRLRVHIRSRNRHVGLCSGALSFKAKI